MLKNIGISELILQTIADTKEKHAVYLTELEDFTHNDIDMVETVLDAADKLGMNVRMGLGFNKDWWWKAFSIKWLKLESQINKSIISEVAAKYKGLTSLVGWYIPHEFFQFSVFTKKQQSYLNNFFKQMTSEINDRLSRDIMIAPFYQGWISWLMPPRLWCNTVQNILNETGVTIMALQDSVGARFNSIKRIPKLFYYTKKATDAIGIKLYADIETFTAKSSGYGSAPQDRIEKQLIAADKYVQGFVAFSIDHYQNKNEPNQLAYYNDYYIYYSSNK
jgi:hypothetical protein